MAKRPDLQGWKETAKIFLVTLGLWEVIWELSVGGGCYKCLKLETTQKESIWAWIPSNGTLIGETLSVLATNRRTCGVRVWRRRKNFEVNVVKVAVDSVKLFVVNFLKVFVVEVVDAFVVNVVVCAVNIGLFCPLPFLNTMFPPEAVELYSSWLALMFCLSLLR